MDGIRLQVRGFTKTGKEFYRFDTNLTEGINTLHVADNSIWLTSQYAFRQLRDHQEVQLYMAPDRINCADVSCGPLCIVLAYKHFCGTS